MITKLSLKVLINLGTILEKELLIKKCVKTLEDSKAHDLVNIDLNNNSSIALYRLGVCFYKEKNYDKAKELFKKD